SDSTTRPTAAATRVRTVLTTPALLARAALPGPLPKLRVLVVDDNRDAADTTATLVGLWGFDAEVAYDGVAPLEVALPYRPAVGPPDISLPGVEGLQLARRLLAEPALRGVHLVAVSGHTDPATQARSAAAGVAEYIVKPADPGALAALLAARDRL